MKILIVHSKIMHLKVNDISLIVEKIPQIFTLDHLQVHLLLFHYL